MSDFVSMTTGTSKCPELASLAVCGLGRKEHVGKERDVTLNLELLWDPQPGEMCSSR